MMALIVFKITPQFVVVFDIGEEDINLGTIYADTYCIVRSQCSF
jgi:hypothetical protein